MAYVSKLRIRFIAIASLAILLVLFSVVGVLNSARHVQTVDEINKILNLLADNGGSFQVFLRRQVSLVTPFQQIHSFNTVILVRKSTKMAILFP